MAKTKNKKTFKTITFKTIDDSDVLLVWKCPDCDETTRIHPFWFQDVGGTPECPVCEIDMIYDHTELYS